LAGLFFNFQNRDRKMKSTIVNARPFQTAGGTLLVGEPICSIEACKATITKSEGGNDSKVFSPREIADGLTSGQFRIQTEDEKPKAAPKAAPTASSKDKPKLTTTPQG